MRKIMAYQCDWCNKIYKTKSAMAKHEKRCFYNPAVKSCWTCNNNMEYDTDNDIFYCKAGKEDEIEQFAKDNNLFYQKTTNSLSGCPYHEYAPLKK